MRITGGCHCGAVTFEAEVDPAKVTVCHCTDCQRLTGTAMRVSVSASRDAFHLSGQPSQVYVKTGDSGRKRLQFFCGTCGAPVYTTGEGSEAATIGIRWGAITERGTLTPAKQI